MTNYKNQAIKKVIASYDNISIDPRSSNYILQIRKQYSKVQMHMPQIH